MVLCDTEIRAALRHKQVIVDPMPAAECITTSALDLTLGTEFKRWQVFKSGVEVTVDPSAASFNYASLAEQYLSPVQQETDGSVLLKPKDFLLGITRERVELPLTSRLAARVEGRSSLARLGLGVHVTAPTIHAGFRGFITLEITNHGALPLKLRPGLKICQLIFEQVFGTPSLDMGGIFQDQTSVSGRNRS
jgi:dCTP deaminase